jgi:hypothetical protein
MLLTNKDLEGTSKLILSVSRYGFVFFSKPTCSQIRKSVFIVDAVGSEIKLLVRFRHR